MARPSFSLGASITRRSALATAAVIGGSVLGIFSAAAQTVSAPVKGVTTCEQRHGATDAGVRCAIRELDGRIVNLNQNIDANKKRGAAADARGAAADQELTCLELIMNDMANNGKKTAALTAVPPKGKACRAARDLGLVAGS